MTRKADPRTARLPVPAGELPAFTPVPRKRARHDGWTAARQRAFIEALADTGSVKAAARAVDMSAEGAYHLRRQPGAGPFRAAWQKALDLGVQRIEDVAMDRALNGVDEPLYSYGKLIGTRKRFNDRLLMFMLRNRAPERFARGQSDLKGLNAIGRQEKRRLKAKWRRQWEKEQRSVSPKQLQARIDTKLDAIRKQVEIDRANAWERLSEETRAAWEAFERLRNRDLEALQADEDIRMLLREGPQATREARNADPKDILQEPPAPEPWDGIRRLKDEGWE
ncbi:hypothetical protein [Altererythrobacter lutimaris]|uniref:Uncharacterized protein n=1 Tax=Altererythrobacter lutimaris TaxID=2743979 RepID=A0A850H7K3_9SPHN|nr:hypothetical protein [Altererythrobacter lutimaris]NVE93853.1 hypothetical protein [Altererythrobacter lutimaris]